MSPALDAALAECDELNITLTVVGDKVTFRAGDHGLSDSLRSRLVAVRPELVEYVSAHGRPDPDPVTFVSRTLEVYRVPLFLVAAVSAVHIGTRPYYRLTPRVWHWLCLAVERRAEVSVGNPTATAECQAAAVLLADLGRWIDAHYRPDQIRRAVRLPPSLPHIDPLPRWVSDPKEQRRAAQTQAVPPSADRPTASTSH